MYNIFNLQKTTLWLNCLYLTLFFNIVAGIVQTFIKSWNQLLNPRVTEVCCLPFEPRHNFFLHLIIVFVLFPSKMFLMVKKRVEIHNDTINNKNLFVNFRWTFTFCVEKPMTERTSHLSGLWIGAAISNTSHSNKAVILLSNEHSSQVKNQGRRQCFHNKHKKFPYRPTRDVFLLVGHASYL